MGNLGLDKTGIASTLEEFRVVWYHDDDTGQQLANKFQGTALQSSTFT
jgi:hypothetical protein